MIPLKDENPISTTPIVVYLLIAINIAVFFHQLSLGEQLSDFFQLYAVIPQELTASINGNPPDQSVPELFTLVSSQFLHGGWMHIGFNLSLRGISQTLCKLGQLFELSISYISPSTIRNWCLKMGLYCLSQPIEEGPYALILDESVEIGKEKLLLLLGVPLEKSSFLHPLSIQDVRVLTLKVQHSWKAEEVAQLIEQTRTEHPITFSYAISDKGSTLRKALKICNLK